MARAVLFERLGGPEVLELRETPIREPGEGEARVRMEALGLNRAELMYMHGQYHEKPELPSRIGYEVAGVVEAVGTGVDPLLVGKRLATVPGYSMNQFGSLGEQAIVPAKWLAAFPDAMSSAEGAAIWMQYLTAYSALRLHTKVQKGDFVIITAASSSVGLAAIQIVKAEGGVAIAATRHGDKREALLAEGADYVIATEEEDLVARVGEITGGKLARIVFDPVAGPTFDKLMAATARGGILCVYGILAPEPTNLPVVVLLGKGLRIQGCGIAQVIADPQEFEKAKQYVVERLEDGRFKPTIARTFPFEQFRQAYEYLASNQQIGKVVITVP